MTFSSQKNKFFNPEVEKFHSASVFGIDISWADFTVQLLMWPLKAKIPCFLPAFSQFLSQVLFWHNSGIFF